MNPIDRDHAARRAEEARRRAEEARRQAEELARARSQAPSLQPPVVHASRPERPAPQDLLERAPRLFGREIPLDGPLTPPIESPPPESSSPNLPVPHIPPAPRTDVLPRLAPPPSARAGLDADFDRQQLLEALSPIAAAVATADSGAAIAEAGRALVGVSRVDWDRVASGLLGTRLRAIAEKAGSLEARAVLIKKALAGVETRQASTLVGFREAGGLLEKAAFQAGVARELAKLVPGEAEGSLERMAAARQELVDVHARAGEAAETLRELAGGAAETPWALGEIGELEQGAIAGQWQLSQTESQGQMLAAMDAGAGVLAEAPAPEAATADSPEAVAAPGAEFEFTEEDLARIGSGLDPSKPPAQTSWSEQMVNTVCELGRQQGGVTDEQGGRNLELAKVVLGSGEGEPGARPLEAVDLAAVLKMSGVDLAKVDPSQLQSATRYVSGATSLEDQQQKLRKAIDSFQVLEKIGLPKMTRQQMVDELWGVAKVPGHALTKLSDAEVSKKLQEVLSAVNAGPGKSEIKIGKYNLKLEVGENGTVTKSSSKKPGFFSKVWGAVKKVAPIALTALSFTPLAPFALAAQGAISLVQAIKAKSLLGIVTAAASVAGGAAGIVNKFAAGAAKAAKAAGAMSKAGQAAKTAGTAAKVAKVANSATRALQGVSSLKSGNVVGGLASLGSGIASGLSTFAAKAAKGLGKFADDLNKISTKMSAVGTGVASFESYKKAGQAIEAAKQALQAARASGDLRAIALAEKQLSQAESQKRAALIGGAVGAASAASAWVENRSLFADESQSKPPAQTVLQSRLRLLSQGLGVAQGVAAKDVAGAAVAALSFGSTVSSVQKGGKENRFNDAANLAQAGLSYYQAEKGRTSANQGVTEAQARLDAARRGGDTEVIRQAEAGLKHAKGAAESALMGGMAAGQSLLSTARDIGERDRAVKAARKVANESTLAGRKTSDRLKALAEDPKASPEAREAARSERERLKAADDKFQTAIVEAKGDPAKMEKVIEEFAGAHLSAASWADALTQMAASTPAAPASPTASDETGASPGLASLRRPQRIGAAQVTKGVTVWEVSQRTGVPVERILEFNRQSGNTLDPDRLQIGQQILVPLDEEDIKFNPRSAEQVQQMKQRAIAEKKARESMVVPPVRSSDEPGPAGEDLRSKSLQYLANDRAIVADDIKNAEFKLSDPTTWVDTKEEKARAQARDAFRQSVDRLEAVLKDPKSTDDQIRTALVDKQTALNLYSSARGVAERKNEGANYATPVAELYRKTVADPFHEQTQKAVDAIDQSALPEVLKSAAKLPLEIVDKEVSFDFKGAIQTGQDALHSVTKPLIDMAEKSGAPAPLVGAATLPLHVVDSVVNFDAGALKGAVSIPEGLAHMAVHPVDTVEGLTQLAGRAMEATPQGRTALFLKDLATGKFKTEDEALKAMRDSMDPLLMAKASLHLGGDVLKGVFADAIKLAQEGKYDEAAGTVVGQFADVFIGFGATKLGTASRAGQALNEASRVERTVDAVGHTARVTETTTEAARAAHAAELTEGLDHATGASRALGPGEVVAEASKAATEARLRSAERLAATTLEASGDAETLARATDAFASARAALDLPDAGRSVARFNAIEDTAKSAILDAYGGPLGRAAEIPTEFMRRRVTVLGALPDAAAAGERGARILKVVPDKAWSPDLNALWLREAIHNNDVIKLTTAVGDASLSGAARYGGLSVYARELDMALQHGYRRLGDFLVPPSGARIPRNPGVP